jgi:hypothetical protein
MLHSRPVPYQKFSAGSRKKSRITCGTPGVRFGNRWKMNWASNSFCEDAENFFGEIECASVADFGYDTVRLFEDQVPPLLVEENVWEAIELR